MLNGLPLPTILRYGLTGVLAVVLFLVMPVVLYDPSKAIRLATPGMVATLSAVGFLLGFVLDGLKLYQLSPGYEETKKQYFDKVTVLVGGDLAKARSISSLSVRLEKELNGGEIFFQHSRWVMVTVFGSLFSVSGAAAAIASVPLTVHSTSIGLRFLLAGFFALIFGWRMFKTSKQIREHVNNGYLHFLQTHWEAHGLTELLSDTAQQGTPADAKKRRG